MGTVTPQIPADQPEDRPPFDVSMARKLVGKRVLIGLTVMDQGGEVDHHEQKHGVVERAAENGVAVRLSDGELYWMPPDLGPWKAAAAGEYRLRSTGEVLVDPDYIATWFVTQDPPGGPEHS
jgi:hypothetical protein